MVAALAVPENDAPTTIKFFASLGGVILDGVGPTFPADETIVNDRGSCADPAGLRTRLSKVRALAV